MTSYSFEVDDDTWDDWAETVPRRQPLDQRLIELIVADTEGRVAEEGEVVIDEDELAELRQGSENGG